MESYKQKSDKKTTNAANSGSENKMRCKSNTYGSDSGFGLGGGLGSFCFATLPVHFLHFTSNTCVPC